VLGAIMTILDATIVNVALPTLGGDFGAPISTIQWVPTIYLLAFASVIPATGWASERFGAKRVWLAALVAFMLGSLLCGLSNSVGELIGARALQGLGGGMILPVGQVLLGQAAGPQRIGRVMSIVGVPLLLGPVFGPVIGGAIVGSASWRWIFFVNLPVGLVALALAIWLLPSTPGRGRRAARCAWACAAVRRDRRVLLRALRDWVARHRGRPATHRDRGRAVAHRGVLPARRPRVAAAD
jgi:EmrB/QacA subfamily drug resistance transporter